MTEFVNLHCHTHYSLLDSLISPKELFDKAKELGQKAIAITDHGSCAAFWEALKLSKETGVKLIAGCEMYFVDDTAKKTDERFRHVILLAKNAIGYKNLLTLNKLGFDNSVIYNSKRVYSVIDWKLLEQYKEGLICLTSCCNGIIARLLMNKKFDEAEKHILKLKEMFGDDLGLEIQANTLKRGSAAYKDNIEQVFVNAHLIRLGKKHDVRVVATANCHYVNKSDAETHDVLLAIGYGQPVSSRFRLKYECPEFYIKSGDDIKSFFERNYGAEQAEQFCANSVYFADKCETPEWIDPKFSNPSGKELPEFPVKDEKDYPEFLGWSKLQSEDVQKLEEDKQYLRYKCEINLKIKFPNLNEEKLKIYQDRIAEELDVMEYHGFSSYMLIVADYIRWARENHVSVGVGRGSVGGSIIAYLLEIHQADPIKYNLIFARFHNKEKSSFPDIDTDFSDRDKVESYCRQKYGDDHVARVSNINTITPKVYARDIARSCEFGGSKEMAVKIGTDIADIFPKEITKIEDASKKIPLYEEYVKRYPELQKYSTISGRPRSLSTHAAGIVISKRSLVGLVPLRRDKDGILCLEYTKEVAEDNGLVKMDLLGLSTLNTIDSVNNLIIENGKNPLLSFNYNDYDKLTYNIISSGNTFGVFQLGTSSGTMDLCRKIAPKSLEEISYINSLARPSARDMRSDFIATKNGKRKYTLLDKSLERSFGETFGFGLYEECLFFLAQDVAGWDLHSADRLRKLTKEKGKNPKKAEAWRQEFINDAVNKKNIDREIARRVWDEVISLFSGYGFNHAHSIFYSMMAFQTAYLKAHFPVEFLLANLMDEVKSNAPTAEGNIVKIKNEIRDLKIKIIPPDLNRSELRYVIKDNQLITGLDAIKFVSDDAIKDIISKRPFSSFQDFMVRIDSKKVRANTIQALAMSGCLDSFNIPRQLIYLYCQDYRKKIQVWKKKHDNQTEQFVYPWPEEKSWTIPQLYAMEYHYLNEGFITGIKDAYGNFFKEAEFTNFNKIKQMKNKTTIKSIKGVIKDLFVFRVKKEGKYQGQEMAKITLEDVNGDQCGLTVFPDRWVGLQVRMKELHGDKYKIDIGIALHFSGSANLYEDEIGIILDKVYNIQPFPQKPVELKAKKVSIKTTKKKEEKPETIDPNRPEEEILFEEIEDDLINNGFINYDDEEDED